MNYEKLYFAFIEKYKNQEFEIGVYTEKHHIIPRHAGGDDSKENLIRLTYKQHVFAHKLLWKAYSRWQDLCAWRVMTSQDADFKQILFSSVGKANVESGFLDKIRPMANTPAQREHARKMAVARVESGEHAEIIKLANDAWRGQNHTEQWKIEKSKQMTEWASREENYLKLIEMQKLGSIAKAENSKQFSDSIIQNAERNEEFLHKSSSRSKNKFISPEGLEFDSPIFAAQYYGNVEYYIIENWCKRKQHGWSRKPKAV